MKIKVRPKAPRLLVVASLLLSASCMAVTCFQWSYPKAKYNPMPWCAAGRDTPPPDAGKGWQCYKYYIYDEDYGWGCESSPDGASACDLVQTTVTVTEWGGFCTGTNNCGINTNDVLHFKELWAGTYGHQEGCFTE